MSHTTRLLALLLAAALALTATAAEDSRTEKEKKADEVLHTTLRHVINRGADLYNNFEHGACYRLFQGSLMTVKPSLERYPELQKSIAKGLASAEKDPVMWRRAMTLRKVLDDVRKEINPNKDKDKLPPPKVDEKKDEKIEDK